MVAVLKRYRIAVVILLAMMILALTWFFVSRQNLEKIPSRGVFVFQSQQLRA